LRPEGRAAIESGVPELAWCYLGRVDYAEARQLQTRLAAERARRDGRDLLLLLEHPPVLTLGRHAGRSPGAAPLAVPQDAPPLVRTDRGGGLTYHGPGQIVGYPVVALRERGRAVRALVASIGQAMCDTAQAFQVPAFTREEFPGAWARRSGPSVKLGSIGLAIARGVTLHGCALNVQRCSELGFVGIDACGLNGVAVSSLESESGSSMPALGEIAPVLADALATRLGYTGAVLVADPGGSATEQRLAGRPGDEPATTRPAIAPAPAESPGGR
jgi:lipoyl(octanoyl) transferase